MKISCEVVKDLLPLYKDGVCSEESKVLVEEHLSKCEECRKLLDNMNIELDIDYQKSNLEEGIDLENLSKKWNRKIILSMLKGVAVTVIIGIAVLLIAYVFIGIRIV